MTSLNLKEFYENDKQQKIQAREMIKKQIDAQKVVLSDALKSGLKPTNIQLFGGDNIVSLIEQNIYGYILSQIYIAKTWEKGLMKLKFNGVTMILSLDEMHKSKVPNDFEYTAQERQSTRFSLGGKFSNFDKKIMCYIRQKISEYHDNLGVDDTLSTSTTQKYIKAKNKHDKERTIQEVKEKMKSLPELEFVGVQRVDFTNIDHSILIEYNIVRDLDGMAEISGDTLRNMGLNNKDPYGRGIYRYAETRAKLMQKKISQGATLKDIAMSTSYDADTEGIFGFMKSAAKSVLIQCRKYGSELQDIKS